MADPLDVRAYRKLRCEGLTKLTKSAINKIIINPLMEKQLSMISVLDRDDLHSKIQEDGEIWTKKSHTYKDINIDRIDNDYYDLSDGYDFSDRRIYELSNVTMFGSKGLVTTDRDEFLLESVKNNRHRLRHLKNPDSLRYIFKHQYLDQILPISNNKIRSIDTAVNMVMGTFAKWHYGHWLVEYLPKLLMVSKYKQQTGARPKLIINSNPPQFMYDSLKLLGYNENHIIEWDNEMAKINTLVVPIASTVERTLEEHSISPTELRWLREQLTREVTNTDDCDKRIYVSRQGQDKRRIQNFEEIKPVLNSFGFDIIRPETMSFEEQIRIFASSDVIIGVKGSGLHNSLLSSKGTSVLEILPPNYMLPTQRLIDKALNHHYHRIAGTGYEGKPYGSVIAKHRCFKIDPDIFEAKLNSIIN